MKIGAIIFSRFSSKRLPGKALIEISGRSLLGRVIDRTREIQGIDKIIVATSSEPEDDQIEDFVRKENIDVYRGSLNDVVSRTYETCLKYNLERFIRICGDRPFFSPYLITDLLKISLQEDFDIITTTFPRTYPPGLTCEIIKTELLTKNLDAIIEKEDKEHLTSFFYKNPEKFNIKNVSPKNQINLERINLCVDNDKDLERAIWISDQMIQNNDNCYNIEEIIALAREWEENFSRLGKD